MEIRSVQKSGRMYYLYLPSAWCRKHKISSSAKLTLEQDNEGNLIVHPVLKQDGGTHLNISVDESNIDYIEKVIVACFLHPTASFTIKLSDKLDISELLRRTALNNMVVIEMEQKTIQCESPLLSSTPLSLLLTLLRKTKNLLTILKEGTERELIDRLEEDIDRTKILIEKAVISTFVRPGTKSDQLRNIDLYYASTFSRTVERIVDNLIQFEKPDRPFYDLFGEVLQALLTTLEQYTKEKKPMTLKNAMDILHKIGRLRELSTKSTEYHKRRVGELCDDLGDLMVDWSITEKLQPTTVK